MNDLPATTEFDLQTGEIIRPRAVQTFAPAAREEPTTHSMSSDIGSLALALAKAQAEVKGALKDAANPFFKSKYADLESVWKACREALSKNELAVIQTPFTAHNNVGVVTILAHSSGQWIQGRIEVPPAKYDAQSAGSTITYLRRYALMAMVGVAPEDDDGNQASGRDGRSRPPSGPQPVQPPVQAAAPSYTQEEYDLAKATWQPLVAAIKSAKTLDQLAGISTRFADGLAAIKKVSATQAEQIDLAIQSKKDEIVAKPAAPFDDDADRIPL